jgi:hypothetical protein
MLRSEDAFMCGRQGCRGWLSTAQRIRIYLREKWKRGTARLEWREGVHLPFDLRLRNDGINRRGPR